VLEISGLTKRYQGLVALSNLSFCVASGEIVGLLGPNGAGKTTCLRCIAGIIRPGSGHIVVGGCDLSIQEREAKRLLAFVPEQPNPYETLTVYEHLRFIALAYDTMEDFDVRAEKLLSRFDLAEKRNELVGTLSKGMRQKLTIACAFIHRAQLFLFDEPLIGLDPRGARELKALIVDAAKSDGAAVLISTHMLDTAQNLCDRIVILRKGEKVADGALADLRDHANARRDATLEDIFLSLTGEEKESAESQSAT
jgi:ABC-2 type transport system ATP-binding protein